jgi:hypothetical protein
MGGLVARVRPFSITGEKFGYRKSIRRRGSSNETIFSTEPTRLAFKRAPTIGIHQDMVLEGCSLLWAVVRDASTLHRKRQVGDAGAAAGTTSVRAMRVSLAIAADRKNLVMTGPCWSLKN